MITVFLGAGFSTVGGVPLASRLFDVRPEVDRITRERLVQRVLGGWRDWRSAGGGQPEEYLAFLQAKDGKSWHDARWYVSLVVALAVGRVEPVGARLVITRHNVDRTTGVDSLEAFWTTIFRRTEDVAVVTTNYDILAERGLRHRPRPRVHRPGFHYGGGAEELAGGGYPSYAHIQKVTASGRVPVLKLHGSVSWSFRNGRLVRYHDCRPAIRGDAAIVAPTTAKKAPAYLGEAWTMARSALVNSCTWILVGYSLPPYDVQVHDLLQSAANAGTTVHVLNPDPNVGLSNYLRMPACSTA